MKRYEQPNMKARIATSESTLTKIDYRVGNVKLYQVLAIKVFLKRFTIGSVNYL